MIDLLEGIPGSGKSYEAVVYHVLPALKKGRKVITNLPLNIDAFVKLDARYADLIDIRKAPRPVLGMWDAEAANRGENCFKLGQFLMPEDEEADLGVGPDRFETFEFEGRPAMHPPAGIKLFGHVWDFYDDWRGPDNIGPLYVIDECHVSFPRENLRKKRFTPDDVIQWFKLHRHYGADVVLMTQRMRALEEDIAGLAQFHIRVHKAHFLGKSDEYIRKVLAGYKGGEVQVNERKYLKQYFPLYKSHTQGGTVIESGVRDLSSTFTKVKRSRNIMFGFSALAVVYAFWANLKPAPKPPHVETFTKAIAQVPPGQTLVDIKPDGTAVHVPSSSIAQNPYLLPDAGTPAPAPAQPAKTAMPEPLEGKTVHMVGMMHMPSKGTVYRLSIAQGSRVHFDVNSAELEEAGYAFKVLAHCMAVLTWDGKSRPVTCDAPASNAGTEAKPVVVTDRPAVKDASNV